MKKNKPTRAERNKVAYDFLRFIGYTSEDARKMRNYGPGKMYRTIMKNGRKESS